MSNQIIRYSRFWAISLVSVVAGLIIFSYNDAIYVPKLLNIQFSPTAEILKELIGSRHIELINNTKFDFVFISLYSLLFFLSLKIFELSLQVHFKWYYYTLCFVPGIVDLFENYLLLKIVENDSTINDFKTYFWSVRIKWTTIISFVFMVLTILLYYGLVLFGKGYNLLGRLLRKTI